MNVTTILGAKWGCVTRVHPPARALAGSPLESTAKILFAELGEPCDGGYSIELQATDDSIRRLSGWAVAESEAKAIELVNALRSNIGKPICSIFRPA